MGRGVSAVVVRCTLPIVILFPVFWHTPAGKDRSMASIRVALKLLMPSTSSRLGVIDFHNLVDSHHRQRFRCCCVVANPAALGSGFGLASVSPWPHSGASLTTFTAMTAIWLVIVQWISSALGGYLTGRLRTKCVGGLGRPGTPSFSRHGCSSAKGSKTRGVAPSYRRSWRNTRRRDRHPSLLRSFGRAPGHLRLGPQRDHPRSHPLAIDRPLARVKEMVAQLARGRTFPPAPGGSS